MDRAPAVPLIVHDPFFSIWSAADRLTDVWPSHWTGKNHSLCGMLRVDGTTYRFMGPTTRMAEPLPAMQQTNLTITPTTTQYWFAAGGVELKLSFVTPALPDDLDLLARPLTYISLSVRSIDSAGHQVEAYLDASAGIAVGQDGQSAIWGRHRASAAQSLWLGSATQPVLGRAGDELSIDWGYLHFSPCPERPATGALGDGLCLRTTFAETGIIPDRDGTAFGSDLAMPASASSGEAPSPDGYLDDRPPFLVAAWSADLGLVGDQSDWSTIIGYDQTYAVEYFGRRLRPYWYQRFGSMIALIERAWSDREALEDRCRAFDSETIANLARAGDATFVRLAVLAFRQCLGGHVLVSDHDGTLLHFSKENSSNGCMGTVDIAYPASPFFLVFNPELLKAQLVPILDYAATPQWPFPYAPHDIGRFPLANGQVYGGGERSEHNQMPIEECGNLLIMVAAHATVTGSADGWQRYWSLLSQWADYLVSQGYDPGEQLCTDDFDGPFAHHTNLAGKSIVAIGAAAKLAKLFGDEVTAVAYRATAEEWAAAWLDSDREGDHYRMCFDRSGSWSQKYNLVWDRVLGLRLFPDSRLVGEVRKYKAEAGRFGTPLQGLARHTKLDWLVWSACLSGARSDQDALLAPLGEWLDVTDHRSPLSDWFDVDTGGPPRAGGFRGRSVVGGVFMPLFLASRPTSSI
ncbi:glutaminase domain-containing protein [Bauldia sp.]|uniref:glutaminase family protein n=1 Tax=Bauldia sp. TaxID=2575872 RepID=UPI003BAB579E